MILEINGKNYEHFISYSVELNYHSIASTFSFLAFNDVNVKALNYDKCKIYLNENLLITGVILRVDRQTTEKPELIKLSGYSLSGVLNDVNIPTSLYPLQMDNLSLKEICDRLFKPFKISYSYDSDIRSEMFKKFTKVTAKSSENIYSFIADLCYQRGVHLTHKENGFVFFAKRSIEKLKPIYNFKIGESGTTAITLEVDGQKMNSEITILKQATSENPDSAEYTIKNPFVNSFRPKVKVLTSGDNYDIKKSARIELSEDLRAISLTIKTTQFVKPGNLISVSAYDKIGIADNTVFFVESTVIEANETGITYALNCKLKDCYSTSTPKNIFV